MDAVASKPKKKKSKPKPTSTNMLGSGSTLINLACTNNPFTAFMKGQYYFFVGDSASGKTFLTMSCFAEAVYNPNFEDYELIYDNSEDGMHIDLKKMFSPKVAKRIVPPAVDKEGVPIHSETIEDFYYNVDDKLKAGKPFIYVLDSMDGLSSQAEADKFEEQKDAHRKGKQVAGSYGDGKAKKNSTGLRKVTAGLTKTKSILIIISQTRDNLGYGHEKKSRSGGHALRFYACIELWSTIIKKITKTVKGKTRQIGITAGVKIKKNRVIGDMHEAVMDIYPSYGIDDIGSCIDYLVKEKWWSKSGRKINAKEFKMKCARDKLVSHIEAKNLEKKLKIITGRCWNEIRKACALKRKRKYE